MILFVKRELRALSHRTWIILFAVSLGVAAITAVHALADSVRLGIKQESRPMMAGDLVARSMHVFPDEIFEVYPNLQSQTIDTLSMALNAKGESVLIEVKGVTGNYPHYGELVTEPGDAFSLLDKPENVLVEASLLRRLSISVGDSIRINGLPFVVSGLIDSEPDRMNVSLSSGPRVMMSLAGLERSEIARFGSRITRKIQWKTEDSDVLVGINRELEKLIESNPGIRIQSSGDTGSAQRSIQNTERFLSLVGLMALLIGLIGVAQSIRAWLVQQRRNIATYRCLGMTRKGIFKGYISTVFVVVMTGVIVGLALAQAGLFFLFSLLESYLPMQVDPRISLANAIEGGGTGLFAALLIAVIPLWQYTRIPPLAALRSDVQPVPFKRKERVLGIGIVFFSLLGFAVMQAKSLLIGAIFTLVLVLMTFALLWGARFAAKTLGSINVSNWKTRHALATFRRPGLGVTSAMVALGLGVTIVATIALLQSAVQDQIQSIRSTKAPTNFIIDIQPDQWSGVEEMLVQNRARHQQSAPVVMARLARINDQDVAEIISDLPDADRWSYTREQRLTYDTPIEPTNVMSGSFGTLEANNELCMEERYAERLGVRVGDKLVFDVQGIPLEFQLTAIRRIQWETMNINFFLVGEKAFLEKAPQNRIVAAQLDESDEITLQSQLIEQFPNITVISLRAILTQVMVLLQNLTLAIQGMGLVSVTMGILILIGTLRNTAEQRRKQIQLLKILGVTRREAQNMLSMEFSLLGLIAGTLGVAGACLLTGLILVFAFRMEFSIDPTVVGAWFVGVPITTTVVGWLVFRGLTARKSLV